MISKQDKTHARTAAQLEQKYKFGETFAEVMGIATDARETAEEAKDIVQKNLTPEQIFNLLTDNGEVQGCFRGEDGQLYFNASYIVSGQMSADLIKAGVLSSADGKIQIDLSGEEEPVFNTGISTNGIRIRADDAAVNEDNNFDILTVEAKKSKGGVYYGDMQFNSTTGHSLLHLTETFSDESETDFSGAKMLVTNQELDKAVEVEAKGNEARVSLYNQYYNQGEESKVGDFYVDADGKSNLKANKINPGKKVLFTGSAAVGDRFLVGYTEDYDLFGIIAGTADANYSTFILAYKVSNTAFYGVGGYAGDSTDRLYFVSGTIYNDEWTLVNANRHTVSSSVGSAESFRIKSVIGII